MQRRIREIRDANALLTDSLSFLQQTNTDLLEEMLLLREQMDGIREEQEKEEGSAPVIRLPDPPQWPKAPASPVPPLVPHGENWRDIQTWKNYRFNNSE